MKLSVVIAAFNEGEALAKTIASCIETTSDLDREYEIVLVDDASDDGSVDVVAQRFLNVKICRHDVRQGASAAKATGVSHAQGDVLVFLDGHTKPEYGAIERLLADVQRLKGSAIVTPAVPALDVSRWTSDSEQVGNGYGLDLETFDCGWLPLNELTPIVEFGTQFFESPALIGCAFAVSRGLYEKLLGFDSRMKSWGVEDLDFGLRCWLMGSRILHDPKASIAHRFQTNFETYSVPVEHVIVNQLRMARKIFSPSVWSNWIERCRERVSKGFPDHHDRLWAHAWRIFTDDRPSVEQQRLYLQGRLEHDAFWFAAKFGLPWPYLGKGLHVDKLLPGNKQVFEQDTADNRQGTTRRAQNRPQGARGGQIRAAARYRDPGDLCVIMCLFNLGHSQDKLRNFTFCHSLFRISEIPLIVVECAFGADPWVLDPSAEVMQLRTSAALWQKERLINCGLARVPERCTKVAWIDADVVFENPDWAMEASKKLDQMPIVQLFDRVIRLPRGQTTYSGEGQIWEGFASVYREHPNALLHGDFAVHGHTGFAWAARREVFSSSLLYDGAVAGGGDHVMAHAFCGDWESPCLTDLMVEGSAWYQHAVRWARGIYPLVKGKVGFVPGAVQHLWHGEVSSRKHVERNRVLRSCDFDPVTDLRIAPGGCWEWCSQKPDLNRTVSEYLSLRRIEAD
jgi:glycosyltransferase involved in cell wall biosynthesis